MNVRLAKLNELQKILEIFDIAKSYMRKNGNNNQWINGYPSIEILTNDIINNNLYVIEDNNDIFGVFAFIIGEDVTYNYIDGKWLNDENYGTIHRIASNGKRNGIMKECLKYCKSKIQNIKIDTHRDNFKMQKLVLENDFKYCGIIYLLNGDERLAYHWTKE